MPPRKAAKPSLIAAAQQSAQAPAAGPSTSSAPRPVDPTPHDPSVALDSLRLAQPGNPTQGENAAETHARSGSASSSTLPGDVPAVIPPKGPPGTRLKFVPNKAVKRRVVKPEPDVDVKPEPAALRSRGTSSRGARGSTRGAAGNKRGTAQQSVAVGLFGGVRKPVIRPAGGSTLRTGLDTGIEEYSDGEDKERKGGVIDIDAVSGLHESAPTSLQRDRQLAEGKLRVKPKAKTDPTKDNGKGKGKGRQNEARGVNVRPGAPAVKAEPVSPEKRRRDLPNPNAGQVPLVGWERADDEMLSEDEEQDRDERGRQVRNFMQSGGVEIDDEVNETERVDLSESEDEDSEGDMEGDFVAAEGYDNPEDKLFMFQFPRLFPRFLPNDPVDMTQDDTKPDIKPDVKPTAAQLNKQSSRSAKKPPPPPAEGRIGTMVVMKSGRVKMVLGSDIVMDVRPGVPPTFLQHIVHLGGKDKAATVLGEIHKQYVVTPDIDRLLVDLFKNGGKTPGDLADERRRGAARVKVEEGLVKME